MKRSRSYYIIPRTREVNVEMYQAVRAWAAVPSGRSVRTSPGAWCRPDSCRQPGCGQQRSRRCRVSRRGRLGGRRPIRVRPPAPTKRPVLAPGRARCLCMRVGGSVGGWVGGCWWVSEVCVGFVCVCVCGCARAPSVAVSARLRFKRHGFEHCQCSLALRAPYTQQRRSHTHRHTTVPARASICTFRQTGPRRNTTSSAAGPLRRRRLRARPLPCASASAP
jgi:hypothetical protein